MQPVIKILAESAGFNLDQRIPVGRAKEADINLLHCVTAHTRERPGLDKAQKLRLEVDIQFADFIEEERPPVRLLGSAVTVADGAGEGALHVTENLRLHQVLGYRRAVQRDEGPFPPGTSLVNGLGAELLAGATLAGDENRGPAGRSRIDHPVYRLHGERTANKSRKFVAREGLLEDLDNFQQARFFKGVPERHPQTVGRKRLHQKIGRAKTHGLDGHVYRAVRRYDDNDCRTACLLQGFEDLDPVHVGQLEVEEHHRRVE